MGMMTFYEVEILAREVVQTATSSPAPKNIKQETRIEDEFCVDAPKKKIRFMHYM